MLLLSVYWVLEATISVGHVSEHSLVSDGKRGGAQKRTLNICHALGENLLQHLGILQLLLHLGDDALRQLLLLALLDLALVANPRVQNGLGLSSQGGFLLQLVGLGLELGGFLRGYVRSCTHKKVA